MIDTLHTEQRAKVVLHGKVERMVVREHDRDNDMLWCEREEGKYPKMCAVSYPMIFAVWDQYNCEWAIFKLPAEEDAELAELAKEQISNI